MSVLAFAGVAIGLQPDTGGRRMVAVALVRPSPGTPGPLC